MKPINPLDYHICLKKPHYISGFSAWVEHIPFAFVLIQMIKPQVFVELGTHYGDSYCAFCQTVKELNLNTRCYAIDTWAGDSHAGFYSPNLNILERLRSYHDPLYGDFSKLLKKTFDEALSDLGDGSVDLLHIDGWHTYGAVKHDFEKWLPKMSPRGVIIFHDTNIRERDFGVWKLWGELKGQYPHFEFVHGHGLGILGVGKNMPMDIQVFLSSSEEEILRIRRFFFELGNLQVQLEEKNKQLEEKNKQLEEKNKRIDELLNSWSWKITKPLRWLYANLIAEVRKK